MNGYTCDRAGRERDIGFPDPSGPKGEILFYEPSFAPGGRGRGGSPLSFPSISITGTRCALSCKHCGGRLLRGMIPAGSPEELLAVCEGIKERGGIGCLISGGCDRGGSVPLAGFLEAISRIKRDLGLKVVVHTGIVGKGVAEGLGRAGIDAALIDLIGSAEAIREVYGLEASPSDYERSLRLLREHGVPIVPHILVGIHYGRPSGELEALRISSECGPQALAFIVLTPIRVTPMESAAPPSPSEVAGLISAARSALPDVPLALGCMRPKGSHRAELDVLAIRAGVDAIALPSSSAIDLAKSMGIEIRFSKTCCSLVHEDVLHPPS
ncbi:MAG: radical SAM protein [Candidatus Bathyarchaeia archaeon]